MRLKERAGGRGGSACCCHWMLPAVLLCAVRQVKVQGELNHRTVEPTAAASCSAFVSPSG